MKYIKENPLKVFTTFSGYDTQCLALKKAGIPFELIGWSEIENRAIKAHNLIFPEYSDRNYGDICKIDWTQVPDFDFFTYSSPCQSFSIAGLKMGGEEGSGTKSSLLWECKKAIEIKKPKYLMLENVKNLVGNKFYPTFKKWLDYLSSLGYTSTWAVLNGADYGTAQARERVFVVSILNPEYEFEFPRPIKLNISLEDYLQEPHQIPTKCYAPKTAIDEYVNNNQGLLKFAGVTNDTKGSGHVQIGSNTEIGINPDFIRLGKQKDFICQDVKKLDEESFFNENLFGESVDESISEVNKVNKILQIGNIRKNRKIFTNPMQFRVYSPKGVCPTLTLAYPPLILTKENGEYKIREMSGFECMRAMGVEDNDIQKLVDGGVSNSQLMKLAGNSICVDIMMNFYKEMINL